MGNAIIECTGTTGKGGEEVAAKRKAQLVVHDIGVISRPWRFSGIGEIFLSSLRRQVHERRSEADLGLGLASFVD